MSAIASSSRSAPPTVRRGHARAHARLDDAADRRERGLRRAQRVRLRRARDVPACRWPSDSPAVTTDLTLLEWSDLNRPLLQRLSLEAPGTYAHTIAIANLAEAACNAIGANGLLGRVGAYYHDIGKLAKPQYFVENQARGRNPHDMLKPGTSAPIIRNHVQEGLELADARQAAARDRARSSPSITARARSRTSWRRRASATAPVPNAADYIYPGPVPQSAETAVVMLADGVEASARVLQRADAASACAR